MTPTTKKKVQQEAAIGWDADLGKYRAFVLPPIVTQIRSMSSCLMHRLAFALMGDH